MKRYPSPPLLPLLLSERQQRAAPVQQEEPKKKRAKVQSSATPFGRAKWPLDPEHFEMQYSPADQAAALLLYAALERSFLFSFFFIFFYFFRSITDFKNYFSTIYLLRIYSLSLSISKISSTCSTKNVQISLGMEDPTLDTF